MYLGRSLPVSPQLISPSYAARKPSDQLRRAPDTCGITAVRHTPHETAEGRHCTPYFPPRSSTRENAAFRRGRGPGAKPPDSGLPHVPSAAPERPGPAAQYCGAPRRPRGSSPQPLRAGGFRHRPAPLNPTLRNLASFSLLFLFYFCFYSLLPLPSHPPRSIPFNPAL